MKKITIIFKLVMLISFFSFVSCSEDSVVTHEETTQFHEKSDTFIEPNIGDEMTIEDNTNPKDVVYRKIIIKCKTPNDDFGWDGVGVDQDGTYWNVSVTYEMVLNDEGKPRLTRIVRVSMAMHQWPWTPC